MRVNEIFYSLQGEGIRAGEASIFIRLSGCDLTCGFCDTEFSSGSETGLPALYERIKAYPCFTIVWTGGEPLLQLTEEAISYFKERGYYQCVETNGNFKPISGIDHITLSPKVAEHILARNFPNGVTEIKYVWHNGKTGLPNPSVRALHYWLSPQNNGDLVNKENLLFCIELIKKDPKWKLTTQLHKLWKIL